MKKVLAVILMTLLSACATAQTKEPGAGRPDWVDGKTADKYPSAKYVTAVGNGPTREAAVQAAKNAIASSFLQKVESQSSSESRSELKEDTGAGANGEALSHSRSAVQISTNIQLRGAEISQYWQDPANGEHYALATLDKLKVRNSYLLDITRMKEKLASQYAQFQARPDQKTGREILERARDYADLAREAAAIGTPLPATDPVTETQLQALRAKLNELRQSKTIALDLSAQGDEAEKQASDLKGLVANCLQDKGYSVTGENAKDPSAKFSGAYRVSSKHLKMEGFSKFEFSVKANLSQGGHTDKIFLPKEASGRVQDQAFDGIKNELSEAICSAIVQAL